MAETGANLAALLLAAGTSRRLGRPKQLQPIDGEALVTRQARLLLGLDAGPVLVVTGAAREQTEQALDDLPAQCVHHAQWEMGMGSSLACGVRALARNVQGVLVLLVDQWRIEAADLERLHDAWLQQPEHPVVSTWPGASGPPAILPRSLFAALERLDGDVGARDVLSQLPTPATEVSIPHAAADWDTVRDGPVALR